MPAEFVVSSFSADQFPNDGLPEIAFVGRSNVGKSSLLNALLLRGKQRTPGSPPLDRTQLARTSRTPGRTRAVQFYRIDGAFYFVDLPGYGYAKVSGVAMARWRRLAESYLRDRAVLRLVVLIIDIRHGASPLDQQMRDWLSVHKQRLTVVASKADKLKAAERARTVRAIEDAFAPIVPFSAKTGEGVGFLWKTIRNTLQLQTLP